MIGLFNVIFTLLVLLVAYWWANQGLFSSMMHCFCVVIAGAISLAFWEPIVLEYCITGSTFDNYAWGMVLGGLFFVCLLVLRLVADAFVPFDIPLPSHINTIGGGIFGFIAGVIALGMASIACGFTQGPTELMGFMGWARGSDSRGAPMQFHKQWIPAAELTEDFYRYLSLGAFAPSGKSTFATHFPQLAETALSLHRDTFRNGDGRTAISPQDVSVGELMFDSNFQAEDDSTSGAYAIAVTVSTGAFDNGEQFMLSCAQTKLANTERTPKVAYPTRFNQPSGSGDRETFSFDDIGNYATSVPGEQSVKLILVFPATVFEGKSPPSLFFLKGLRYTLPAATETSFAELLSNGEETIVEQDDTGPEGGFLPDVSIFLSVRNSIRPVEINVNLADTMKVATNDAGNFLSGGKGVYKKGSQIQISRSQRVSGFSHPEGTEVIMVDASRVSDGLDIWGDRSQTFKQLGKDVALELVDSRGNGYRPVGYVWIRQGDVEIRFEPAKPFARIGDLPAQPSSGEHKLLLVFVLPNNADIVGVRLGKTLIGTCKVKAANGISD